MKKRVHLLGAVGVIALAGTGAALAQYPERPITFIVATNPGGTSDIGVRTFLPYLEECLGNDATINVEYRPGGQNRIGYSAIASAEPDGYTLGNLTMPNLTTSIIENGVEYDINSFKYVGSLYASYMTLNVRNDNDYETFEELVSWAKENATPIVVGISRFGGDDHFLAQRVADGAGVEIRFIPFGDASLARNALLGGHVGVTAMSITEVMPFIDELRPLAVSTEERFEGLPDVPTLKELGLDVTGGARHTIGVPAGTPEEITTVLEACFTEIANDDAFIKEAEERSLILDPMSGDESADFIQSEYEVFNEIWTAAPWN